MRSPTLLQRFQGALLGAAMGHWVAQGDLLALVEEWQQLAAGLCGTGAMPDRPSGGSNPLALLPLWLYHHESWRRRLDAVSQMPTWQTLGDRDGLGRDGLWLMGEAIAQALHPRFQTNKLPASLDRRWAVHSRQGAPAGHAQWQPVLQDWQIALDARSDWTTWQSCWQTLPLSEQAIAIGLGGFLVAPQDLSLMFDAITRLSPVSDPLSYGFAGAIWGAQQGQAALPHNLLWQFDRANPQVTTGLQTLAAQLLQSWAGLVDLEPAELALQLAGIAAPR